ncbi:FMN-dependent NADH-azoreductase 1 [compost metagenome]
MAGQTFLYTEAGPEGLCGGKKLVIVSTAGGLHAGQPSGVGHEDYLKLLFGFIGITDIEFVRAEGLAYGDDMRTKAMSEATLQIGQQFAAA